MREPRIVRNVRLERNTVHDLAAKVERARRRSVAPVGADHDTCLHLLTVDSECVRAYISHLHAVANVCTPWVPPARKRSWLFVESDRTLMPWINPTVD